MITTRGTPPTQPGPRAETIIRRAGQHDVDPMRTLYREVGLLTALHADYSEAHNQAIRDHVQECAAELPATLRRHEDLFWVATSNELVVGMAGYNKRQRLIHSLFVAEPDQSRGVGSMLLRGLLAEEVVQRAPALLTVSPHNTRAIALYKRFGFRVVGPKLWHIGDSYPMLDISMQRLH